MLTKQLKPAIEAILFLQHKPLPIYKIAETIDETIEPEHYKAAIDELIQDYLTNEHGIELAEIAGGYAFRTKLEHRDMIRRMNQITPVRMSQAMLEVLSIIAFYQPVTREKLEEIRGVECGHHLRNLMDKKLVRMAGRSDAIGKPMLYATTKEFLELFGLPSLKEMPTLQEIEELLPKNEVGEVEDEELRIRTELQAIVANASELEFNDIELEEKRLFGEAEFNDVQETKTETQAGTARMADGEARAQASEPGASAEPQRKRGRRKADAEDIASEAGTSESSPGIEAGANSGGREAIHDSEARISETGFSEHQQDEVAGTIAFGSLSAAQEAEWESDEPALRPSEPDNGQGRIEILASEFTYEEELPGEAAEDHLERGRDEQKES